LVAQRDNFDLHRGLAAERGEKGIERYQYKVEHGPRSLPIFRLQVQLF
jgi:hypothetical protein